MIHCCYLDFEDEQIDRQKDRQTERQTDIQRVVGFHGPEFKDAQIDILINR